MHPNGHWTHGPIIPACSFLNTIKSSPPHRLFIDHHTSPYKPDTLFSHHHVNNNFNVAGDSSCDSQLGGQRCGYKRTSSLPRPVLESFFLSSASNFRTSNYLHTQATSSQTLKHIITFYHPLYSQQSDKMSSTLFSLGFAPFSTTFAPFPTSKVVKAIAIASFAAIAVNALLKTAEPSRAGNDDKHKTKNRKSTQAIHSTSTDDMDPKDLAKPIQDAEKHNPIESATSGDATTDSTSTDKAHATIEIVTTTPKEAHTPKDATKEVDIVRDTTAAQNADIAASADDAKMHIDIKEASPIQDSIMQDIATLVARVVTDKDNSIDVIKQFPSYRELFPAANIVEVIEIPAKQPATRSYRHCVPTVDIVEVTEPPKEVAVRSYRHSAQAFEIIEVVEATRHHSRKESTEYVTPAILPSPIEPVLTACRTSFSTQSKQTIDSEVSSPIPNSPNTVYSEPNVEAAKQPTPVCVKQLEEDAKAAVPVVLLTDAEGNESSSEEVLYAVSDLVVASRFIPSTEYLRPYYTPTPRIRPCTERVPSEWYTSSHLVLQGAVDLEAAEVIDRPDNGITYAQLEDRLWYRLDDNDNALMMTHEEYEDLLEWFDRCKQGTGANTQDHAESTITIFDWESEVKDTRERECGTRYALLNNGRWYVQNDDGETVETMCDDDHEEFLVWLRKIEAEEAKKRKEREEKASKECKRSEPLCPFQPKKRRVSAAQKWKAQKKAQKVKAEALEIVFEDDEDEE